MKLALDELTKCCFHHIHWLSDTNKGKQVRNQECGTSIFENQVGESPNVTESNRITNTGKPVLDRLAKRLLVLVALFSLMKRSCGVLICLGLQNVVVGGVDPGIFDL